MRKPVNLLTRLFSIFAWTTGLFTFFLCGLFVLVLGIFINPKKFDPLVKLFCRMIVRAVGIRVQVEGREHVQPGITYLFMSNHVNIFDVFIVFGYIPTYVRGVELEDHFSWPFYGRLIKRLGMIPISHKNPRSAMNSLKRAQQIMSGGTSIVIFPEGGRTLDGVFKPFMRGTFLLAKQAGADILPMVMIDSFNIKRKGSQLIRPGKMRLRFGAPIPYDSIKNLKTADMSDQVRTVMLELCEN